jgi:hypothetical protein
MRTLGRSAAKLNSLKVVLRDIGFVLGHFTWLVGYLQYLLKVVLRDNGFVLGLSITWLVGYLQDLLKVVLRDIGFVIRLSITWLVGYLHDLFRDGVMVGPTMLVCPKLRVVLAKSQPGDGTEDEELDVLTEN